MLKKLFKRKPQEKPEQQALAVLDAIRHGEPGTRVHHEYMVSPIDGGFHWFARVYAANGSPNENSGNAASEAQARADALAWCAHTSSILKGL